MQAEYRVWFICDNQPVTPTHKLMVYVAAPGDEVILNGSTYRIQKRTWTPDTKIRGVLGHYVLTLDKVTDITPDWAQR